jgi:hypothetical protein
MVRLLAVSAVLTLLVLAPISASRADTVHLKNGGKLVGTVLEETPDGIQLEMAAGTMFVQRDRIESIERDTPKKGAGSSGKPRGAGVPAASGGEAGKTTTAGTSPGGYPYRMELPKGWKAVKVEPPFLCVLQPPSKTKVMVMMLPFGSRGFDWLAAGMTSRGSPFQGCRKVATGTCTIWMGADRALAIRALDDFWSVVVMAEDRTPAAELESIRALAENGKFMGITMRLPPGVDRKKGYDSALAALKVFDAMDVALPGLVLLSRKELERRGPAIDERTLAVVLAIFDKPLQALRQALDKQRGASGRPVPGSDRR